MVELSKKRKRSASSKDDSSLHERKKLKIEGSNENIATLVTEIDYDQDDQGEDRPHRGESSNKPVAERVDDLFTNLNSEDSGRQYLALSEIERGCKHALRRKDFYENEVQSSDRSEHRHKIQQESILYQFLSLSPTGIELMKIWDSNFKEHNKRMCARVMEILALILDSNYFFSTRKSNNFIARTVVKDKLKMIYAVFSGAFHSNGNSFIGGYETVALCRAALQLLASCARSSGSMALYLSQQFNFSFKPFTLLANRKSKQNESHESSYKKDIRTQYIHFVLSFLIYGDVTMILSAMQVRYVLPAIFHELANDAVELIIEFVTAMETYILHNAAITRKAKAAFFGGFFLDQMAMIYKRRASESTELSELLDRFLFTLCCSPTCGIVYSDPDWHVGRLDSPEIRNKPLLRFISLLKPSSRLSHQKLTLEILRVAPDIIEPFLQQIALSYEPRMSSKWIENISFLGRVILLPSPPFDKPESTNTLSIQSNDSLEKSALHEEVVPTQTETLVNNIIPSVLSRTTLSQGLQHDNNLVKFQTLVIVLIITRKFQSVMAEMKQRSRSSRQKQAWKTFSDALVNDVRKKLPDIQVIIGLHQQVAHEFSKENRDSSVEMLYERTLCVLKHYHQCFPGVLSGANFDILKLISSDFYDMPLPIQSHIIALLHNPNLKWTGQVQGSSFSYLGVLLETFVRSEGTLHKSLSDLLYELLTSLELFSGTNNQQAIELECFLKPLDTSSIFVFDRILGDCVRRRYELVDARTNILYELQHYASSFSSPVRGDISILVCSAIRWYYKSNLSEEESIAAQYYLGNVFLHLLHQLVVPAFTMALSIYIIYHLIHTTASDMEIEGSAASYVPSGEKIFISAKENDIVMYHLFGYIVNLFRGVKERQQTGMMQEQTWEIVKLDSMVHKKSRTLEKELKKESTHLSISQIRTVIQQVTPEERLLAIVRLRTLCSLENSVDYFSSFTLDFSLFPNFGDLVKRLSGLEWKELCQTLAVDVFLCAHQHLSPVLLEEFIAERVSLSEVKHIILLINYHSASPADSKQLIHLFITLVSRVFVTQRNNEDISSLILDTLFHNPISREIFFPTTDSKQFESIAVAVAKLCIQMVQHGSANVKKICEPMLDFYGEKLLFILQATNRSSSRFGLDLFGKITVELLRECYAHCSSTIIHRLIEELLKVIKGTQKEEILEELCFHLITLGTHSQSKFINNKLCDLFLIPSVYRIQTVESGPDANILPNTFHHLIELCKEGDTKAEAIILRVLLFYFSPPHPNQNESYHDISAITEYADAALFSCWINDLSPIRASILSLLITTNNTFFASFKKYCNQLAPWKEMNAKSFQEQENFLQVIFSVLKTLQFKIKESLVKKLYSWCYKIIEWMLKASADLPVTNPSRESENIVERTETLIAPLASLFLSLRDHYDLLTSEELEKEIKNLMSQRKGAFSAHSMFFMEQMMHYYLSKSENNSRADEFANKFIFYVMTCTQGAISREKAQDEKVSCFVQIVNRRVAWCSLPVDEMLASRSLSVFLAFTRALLVKNFESHSNLDCIRLLVLKISQSVASESKIDSKAKEIFSSIHGMITGHSKFLPILFEPNETSVSSRTNKNALLALMNVLYSILPHEEFTRELLQVYASAYHATLHPNDEQILGIMNSFELASISMCSIGYVWGESQRHIVQAKDAIQIHTISQFITEGDLVQYRTLLNTCYSFHTPSESSEACIATESPCKVSLWGNYDPRFLLPFLCHVIEFFDVECRRFIDSGMISFAMVSISSKFPKIREWAYFILSRFFEKLKDSRFPEKMEVNVLMNLLRNSLTQANQCVSAVIGVFFAKALIILMHPDHYLYRSVNKFLLHRPTMELDDIPLFFDVMYSTSIENQYQKRNWIFDNLSHSLHRYRDYKLYKRRNVMGIVMSLFDGISVDTHMRENLWHLIKKASGITRIAKDLIENHSLVSWLQCHVIHSPVEVFEIVEDLITQLPSDYFQSTNFGYSLLDLFVMYASRCETHFVPLFRCFALFLQKTQNLDSSYLLSHASLLQMSSKVMLQQTENEDGLFLCYVMMKVIVALHVSDELTSTDSVMVLANHLFFYQWKIAREEPLGATYATYVKDTLTFGESMNWLSTIKTDICQFEDNIFFQWLKTYSRLGFPSLEKAQS